VNTTGFLRTGPSYDKAVAVLDAFLSSSGERLIRDPLKRAVLQQDMWAVFDWTANRKVRNESASAAADRSALHGRLAEAIRRLALTSQEIASLPDNLGAAAASKKYTTAYDEKNPRTPFLPPNLLDPAGPWVCVRGAFRGPSGPVHATYYNGRSPFLVFISLPGGRQATLDYLKDLNQAAVRQVGGVHRVADLPQFPVGTAVALLRQMSVIDTDGQMQVTPMVQTLQMRVYREVGPAPKNHLDAQAACKFRLQRRELFAGKAGGLVPVKWDEPLRVSLLQSGDFYDRPDARHGSIKTVMASCIACHSCGGATIHSIFTFKQDDWVPGARQMAANRLHLVTTSPRAEAVAAVRFKTQRYDWGLLRGWLERGE